MNQGKLNMVKQKKARVNTGIRISELKCTGLGEFNSDDHYIYYCVKDSLRRNGVDLVVNKRVQHAVLGATSKMTERSWFISKSFNITVIQSMPQPLNLKKLKLTEVLKRLTRTFRTNTQKIFIIGDCKAPGGSCT